MTETKGWRRDAVVLSVSAVAMLVYCFPRLLFLGDVVYCGDAGRMHFPIKVFLAERLRAGELPLWYPYDGLGVPFIANAVTAVFHPFTVLSLVLSPAKVMTVSLLSCIVIALAGAYWLARRLGAGTAGAACAGIAFATSGTLVSSLDNLTFLCGACAFPVWLASLHAAIFARRLWGVGLAAAAFAFAMLAGDFQAGYLYALTALPLMLLLGAPPIRTAATCAAAGLAGILLSSVQLLPTLSLLQQMRRLQGIPFWEAVTWSFPPLRLPELFLGDILQYQPFRRVGSAYLLQLMGYGDKTPWYSNVYLGIFAALGAIWAIALGKNNPIAGSTVASSEATIQRPERNTLSTRRVALGLLLITAVLLWLAMGSHGGVYGLFYRFLPLWRSFRYPEKMLNYLAALFAVAGGLGISAALKEPRKAWKAAFGSSAALFLLWAVVTAFSKPTAALSLRLANAGPLVPHELGLEYTSRFSEAALRAAALALVAGALLLLMRKTGLRLGRYVPVLFAAVCLLDAGSVNSRAVAMCTGDCEALLGQSLTAKRLQDLGEPRPGHFRVDSTAAVATTLHPDLDALGAASYRSMAAWDLQTLSPNFSGLFHIETTAPYLPAVPERHWELWRDRAWRTRWSPLFNGRFEVASLRKPGADATGHELIASFKEHQLYLARLPQALPRVFIASPTFVSSPKAARELLSSPEVLSGRTAIFEQSAQPGHSEGSGTAQMVSYEPERVVVHARVDRPGALVLNDAFFPGWTAEIDGKPAPVVRTNYLVRGVLLSQGEHDVVFRYQTPISLLVGACLSIFSLVSILGVAVRPLTTRFRRSVALAAHRRAELLRF